MKFPLSSDLIPRTIAVLSRDTIEALEKVHRRTTVLPEFKHVTHIERLKVCKLPTLHYIGLMENTLSRYDRTGTLLSARQVTEIRIGPNARQQHPGLV